jgi:hypothetical protein
LFETDFAFGRIKRFIMPSGADGGYIGQISIFPPTGPADCVGYTSGFTPDWCMGGGRTAGGTGIQNYNNPYSLATDGNYVYVADYSNNRVDRAQISNSLYGGWIGDVSTTPTDGPSTCTSTGAGTATPTWCIGGTAQASNVNGMFNSPRAIYYDSGSTYLFVADNTARLMEINPSTGAFVGVIGYVGAAPTGCTETGNIATGWCTTGTGNSATNAYGGFNTPNAIAANSTYIFVVDSGNNRLLRFNKSTGAPAGFIGMLNGNAGLNVAATVGGVANPCYNFTNIVQPTPGWCYGTAVGTTVNTTSGSQDNTFNSPRGVWADNNNVYVADTGNNRIVNINPNTGVNNGWKGLIGSTSTPVAMTGTCLSTGAGNITPDWCNQGSAVAGKLLGEFDTPTGLSGDANYIYVIDSHNNRVITVPRN